MLLSHLSSTRLPPAIDPRTRPSPSSCAPQRPRLDDAPHGRDGIGSGQLSVNRVEPSSAPTPTRHGGAGGSRVCPGAPRHILAEFGQGNGTALPPSTTPRLARRSAHFRVRPRSPAESHDRQNGPANLSGDRLGLLTMLFQTGNVRRRPGHGIGPLADPPETLTTATADVDAARVGTCCRLQEGQRPCSAARGRQPSPGDDSCEPEEAVDDVEPPDIGDVERRARRCEPGRRGGNTHKRYMSDTEAQHSCSRSRRKANMPFLQTSSPSPNRPKNPPKSPPKSPRHYP